MKSFLEAFEFKEAIFLSKALYWQKQQENMPVQWGQKGFISLLNRPAYNEFLPYSKHSILFGYFIIPSSEMGNSLLESIEIAGKI